jgi:hypothetical protein
MKKYRLSAGASLGALLAMTGVATDAAAQSTDVKSYSPAMCVSSDSAMVYSSASAYLNAAGWGTMLCPVIKDRYGSSYSQDGRMSVFDNNSSYNMSCYMLLNDANGHSGDWDFDSTSGTPGDDTLYFSVDGTTASDWDATLAFYCSMMASPTLQVHSYWVSEYNLYE